MQYEHIKDGLFRESTKTSPTETRKQWNWPGLTYLDLVDWDLMRPEHQVRFFQSPAITDSGPGLMRGLDKIGRMVLVLNTGNDAMIAVQNGQYLTSVYNTKEFAESCKLFNKRLTSN